MIHNIGMLSHELLQGRNIQTNAHLELVVPRLLAGGAVAEGFIIGAQLEPREGRAPAHAACISVWKKFILDEAERVIFKMQVVNMITPNK